MTKVEILKGAKRELRKRGLHKGWYFKKLKKVENWEPSAAKIPDGPCCVLGACVAAAKSWTAVDRLENLLLSAIPRPNEYRDVPEYSDKKHVTKKHIMNLLDRAIVKAQKEEKRAGK